MPSVSEMSIVPAFTPQPLKLEQQLCAGFDFFIQVAIAVSTKPLKVARSTAAVPGEAGFDVMQSEARSAPGHHKVLACRQARSLTEFAGEVAHAKLREKSVKLGLVSAKADAETKESSR